MRPLSIQFTDAQIQWLDAQGAPAAINRSTVVRGLVVEAMERSEKGKRLKAKSKAA